MVKDHEKAVQLFERENRTSKDADVKAFVEKTLQTLREHLQMVRDTAAKVGGTLAWSGKKAKGDKDATASSTPKQ